MALYAKVEKKGGNGNGGNQVSIVGGANNGNNRVIVNELSNMLADKEKRAGKKAMFSGEVATK